MFFELLGICLLGGWLSSSEQKRIKKRNERQSRWLKENGYDTLEQTKLEHWAINHQGEAIEIAYGYPIYSVENLRMCTEWTKGSQYFNKRNFMEMLCEKHGFKYFNYRFPPEEYRNIK